MNYTEFMDRVEKQVKSMSKEELGKWILNQAAQIDEAGRETFFVKLLEGPGFPETGMTVQEIERLCLEIGKLDIHFTCKSVEIYEEYWTDEWELEYSDTYKVGEKLDRIMDKFRYLLNAGEYRTVERFADLLLNTGFSALDVDGGDIYELDLMEVFDNGLIDFSRSDFIKMCLIGYYYAGAGEKGYERLLQLLKSGMFRETQMEDLLSACGLRAEESKRFLRNFIAWTGKRTGERESGLLWQAAGLVGGAEEMLKTATAYGKNHPYLYLKCCEVLFYEEKAYEGCVKIALEALAQLDKNIRFRGKAAKLGAEAGECLREWKISRAFREEAFWSDSNLENLLFMLNGSYNEESYQELLEKETIHINNIPLSRYSETACDDSAAHEFDRNALSSEEKKILLFFLEDPGEGTDLFQGKREYLGWSDAAEGVIVPLMLACLTERKVMTKAMKAMLDRISGRCGFEERTPEFWEQLVLWREKHFTVDTPKCLDWLEKEIISRTGAVVGGGYRTSYVKAAELVVTLDEIMAEKGICPGGVTRERIRSLHSRKSAFKQELDALK